MKKRLKIKFVDFWKNFDPKDNFFYHFLSKYYNVELSDDPEYLFFSVYGYEHLQYNHCVKILFTGENVVPDFNFCDYALGFHFLSFEDRYLRFPLYLIYPGFKELKKDKKIDSELANRKFCNFVYSNNVNADPLRNYFFEELSKYKQVDSGGRYKNNIGGPVVDKIEFIKDYKFTIAFENSSSPGYTTEKIMEPMRINSIPIYFGNPKVDHDFNQKSFIWVKDKSYIKNAINQIIELDSNKASYLSKLNQPWLDSNQNNKDWNYELMNFFNTIFTPSFNDAKRIPQYGFTDFFLSTISTMDNLHKKQIKQNKIKMKIKDILKFKL